MDHALIFLLRCAAMPLRFLRRFRRAEDGTASVEFAIVFVPFMLLFVSSFESGILMVRHVMLERGVDMAVRAVRIGTLAPVTHTQLKTMICNGAGIIPDCMNTVKLEMRITNVRAWNDIPVAADCIDVNNPVLAPTVFQNGTADALMVVRVCALFKPMFPATGLGFYLPRKSGGYYALVSSSAFVMEPI